SAVASIAVPIQNISEPAGIWQRFRSRKAFLPVCLTAVWIAGFLFLAVRWAARCRNISIALNGATGPPAARELESVARLRSSGIAVSAPRVIITEKVSVPCIWGVFKPALLVPESLRHELTDTELNALIAHEMIHLERRDNLVSAATWWLAAFFWFYPLGWVIEYFMLRERERACDERAVELLGSSADYISAICKAALPGPIGAAGVCCATGSSVRRRIQMISDGNVRIGNVKGGVAIVLVASALAVLTMTNGLARARGLADISWAGGQASDQTVAGSRAVGQVTAETADPNRDAAKTLTPDPKEIEWLTQQIARAPEIPVKFENADAAPVSITSATAKTLTGEQIERGTGYRPARRSPDTYIVLLGVNLLNNTNQRLRNLIIMFGAENEKTVWVDEASEIEPYGSTTLNFPIGIGTASSLTAETFSVSPVSVTFDHGNRWVSSKEPVQKAIMHIRRSSAGSVAGEGVPGGVAGGVPGGVGSGLSGGDAGGVADGVSSGTTGGVGSGTSAGAGSGTGEGVSGGVSADAAPTQAKIPKIIRKSGGALSASALKRVEPRYPEDAKAAGIKGAVIVEVTIDEEGKVIEGRPLSGQDALKQAAVDAARQWTFAPTTLSGVPVKVIGTITFNFEL
ncbi:MAG: TonB family protein, partial [Blastocatellia bacterium]